MFIGFHSGLRAMRPASAGVAPQPYSLNANGWTATWTAPPTFDPVGNPQTFSVTRAGFDAAGNAASVTDTVTFMKRLRQPHPNQATLTADQVVLSDYIYQGDTIPGATNNSTRAAPKPLAMWLTRDLVRVTGTTLTARLAVAHAHGRGGRPVAAVKFVASDGVHTVTQTVSTMSFRQWPGSGLYAPYFECSIDTSTLDQGALCTLDAIIYPWVGAAFQLSVDADAYPSANLSILKFLCDRTGAYGTAYAYVDATSGNNATGVVSQTAATAQASPYLTIAAAAAAIQTFNNTNFSRNSASGGVIRLKPGTHNRTTFSSVAVTEIPLVIEADLVTNKASVIVSDNGVTVFNCLPAKTAWRNLTLRKAGGSVTLFDNNATLATMTNMIALENVNIDLNGQSDYAAWFYQPGRMFLEDVTGGSSLMFNTFSTISKHIQMVGCSGPWQGRSVYMACASRFGNARISPLAAGANIQASVGMYVGHCHLTTTTDSQSSFGNTATIGPRGVALVQSVLEQCTGVTGPALSLNDDSGGTTTAENALRIGLTVVGARTNVFYNDTGTAAPSRLGYEVACVNRGRNTKSDLFGTPNGARVGNWPAVFQVGMRYNAVIQGGQDNLAPGTTGAWVGEVAALGSQYGTTAAPLAVAWVLDASFDGTRAGSGNYTPGAASVLGTIPAGYVHYPVDMLGRTIALDGTAVIGALQK